MVMMSVTARLHSALSIPDCDSRGRLANLVSVWRLRALEVEPQTRQATEELLERDSRLGAREIRAQAMMWADGEAEMESGIAPVDVITIWLVEGGAIPVGSRQHAVHRV